jgi:hypothetical protein
MKGRHNIYSPEELAWIEARKDRPRRELHVVFCATFGREDIRLDAFKGLCKRMGWMTGRTGCYPKGSLPHNAGKTCEPGRGGRHPNSQRTQFKKGALPHTTKYLGHERISKDGYIEISVAERNPHTGFERRYVLKHRHLWEKANGPIPKGHCLKCRDGDRLNTDPSNWELIPRSMQVYLQGRWGLDYDNAAPEVRPTIMAIAKAKHAARNRRTVTQ